MKTRTFLSAVLTLSMLAVAVPRAQKLTPQELAGKLSGTWVLNREMSTGFRAPGRRGGALFSASAFVQRGGSGGGASSNASDLTPEQRAEQAAMRQLEQIAERIKITASAESITFVDQRGERTYAITDKSSKIDVGGSPVNVKSKWDKGVLRQEFSNTQAKLVETWGIDDAGHLVLTAKIESMTLVTPDQKAVFDRQ